MSKLTKSLFHASTIYSVLSRKNSRAGWKEKNLASLNKRLRLTFFSSLQELFCKEHTHTRAIEDGTRKKGTHAFDGYGSADAIQKILSYGS